MELSARDFGDIRRIDVRYCHAVDLGDYDARVACFAPDGRFEIGTDPHMTRRGRAELRRSMTVRDGKGHVRHWTLGSLIDADRGSARSLSAVVVTHDFGPPAGKGQATRSIVIATGFHTDEFVRRQGRWVLLRRRFIGDWGEAVAERIGKPLDFEPVDAGNIESELTPLDYEAIKQLLTRYGYTLDFEDHAGFASCFTPDGVLDEVVNRDAGPESRVIARGRDELWEYALSVSDLNYRGRVRNSAISPLIEGDGARARVSSYAFATEAYGSPELPGAAMARMRYTGVYRDEVVKVDGRWLFAKRTFRKDTLSDVDALVGKPLSLELFRD